MIVKEMPYYERPREKALKFGVKHLSNRELLAVLIKTGVEGHSCLAIADEILKMANGISHLGHLRIENLMTIKGIKKVKAIEIQACIEIAKRMALEEVISKPIITSPTELVNWLQKELGDEKQEMFLVVYLNVKNQIIKFDVLFKGTLNKSLVNTREIFKEALFVSAMSIVIVHNHPSGDVTPSDADNDMTQKIQKAGMYMGVHLIDHIIVSSKNHFSFAENNLL